MNMYFRYKCSDNDYDDCDDDRDEDDDEWKPRRYLLLLDVRCGGGLPVKVLTPEIILASTHHRSRQLIFLLQAINISAPGN